MEKKLSKFKVLFVGDNHCASKQPPGRLDNYCETSAKEFLECLQIGRDQKVDAVVFLGDIFDKTVVQPTIVSKLLHALRSDETGKPWPFKSYAVIGNHDIGHNMSNLPMSSLNTLFSSGLLEYCESIDHLGIYLGHFYPKLDADIRAGKLQNVNYPILALHASLMTVPARDFEGVIFKDTSFHPATKLVLSGHIHSPMQQNREDGVQFINPGSVGRYAMQPEIICRDINVVSVVYDLKGTIYNVEYHKLESSLPAEMIFNFSAKETKKKEIKSNSAYIRKLSEIDMKKFNLINDPIQLIKEYGKENNIEEDVIALSVDRMRDTIYSQE